MPNSFLSYSAIAGVLLGIALPMGSAQASTDDFDKAGLFLSSCAPCHGVTGMGGGPVAAALKDAVPPLATLKQRHSGVFPQEFVYDVIDGRAAIRAHGSRIMPVWGTSFSMLHQGDGAEATVKFLIDALIEHIKSLQVD